MSQIRTTAQILDWLDIEKLGKAACDLCMGAQQTEQSVNT